MSLRSQMTLLAIGIKRNAALARLSCFVPIPGFFDSVTILGMILDSMGSTPFTGFIHFLFVDEIRYQAVTVA